MITSFRKQLQDKELKKVMALAIIISLVGSVVSVLFVGRDQARASSAITVNGKIITVKELQRNYMQNYQIKEQIKQQYGDLADFILRYYGLSGDIQEVTINNLIKEKLFQDLADKLDIKVGSKYLEDKLVDLIFLIRSSNPSLIPNEAIMANNNVNVEYLNEYLKRAGITTEEFDDQVKDILKKDLVVKLISQSSAVPSIGLKELYIEQNVPRSYDIIKLSFDNYINKVKDENIFDKDIEDYYKNNLDSFKTPEKRSATIWEFGPQSFNIKVNDKEIQRYYEANKEDFVKSQVKKNESNKEVEYKSLSEVKSEIEKILKQQKFIKQFSLQASQAINNSRKNKAVIESFISKKNGQKQQSDNITHDGGIKSNKLFNIKRIDGYTYWSDQDKGYIARLDNIQKSKVKDLEEVKGEIKETLRKQRATEMLASDLKNAYQELLSKNKDINKIAENLGLQVESIKLDPKKEKELNELKNKNLPIDTMLNMTVNNSSYYVIDQDGYLILLKQVDEINNQAFKEKEKELYNQLRSKFENIISNAYLAYLQKNAKIEYIGLAKEK